MRECKKQPGKPYEKDVPEGLEIKVLGQGYAQCNRLEKDVMEVMTEINLVANMEHIRDIKEIGKYGVLGTFSGGNPELRSLRQYFLLKGEKNGY